MPKIYAEQYMKYEKVPKFPQGLDLLSQQHGLSQACVQSCSNPAKLLYYRIQPQMYLQEEKKERRKPSLSENKNVANMEQKVKNVPQNMNISPPQQFQNVKYK